MPMFPHGRPTELLVQLNCQPSLQPSTATDDFSDCPSDSDSSTASGATASEEPKRDPRYDVPWVEYDIVRGWQSVHAAFHTFARQCDCWPLTCRSGHVSQAGITYRMECGYSNRIGCPWQCRVFIAFDQGHALTQYQRKYSIAKAPRGSTEAADTRCYDRQTMFVVPHDLRMFTHANHVCVISTAHVHTACGKRTVLSRHMPCTSEAAKSRNGSPTGKSTACTLTQSQEYAQTRFPSWSKNASGTANV